MAGVGVLRISLLIAGLFGACGVFSVFAADRESSSEPEIAAAAMPVTVEVFFRHGCPVCDSVKRDVLPPLAKEYGDRVIIQPRDMGEGGNYRRFLAYQEYFRSDQNEPVYVVVASSAILSGLPEISGRLRAEVEKSLSSDSPPEAPRFAARERDLLRRRAENFSFAVILLAGLIDGINPCVFSTLVFFISILYSLKSSRQRILAIGLVYCASCFLTYLLMGFGIFQFLHAMGGYARLRAGVEIFVIGLLLIFSLLSFRDAFIYLRRGKAESILVKSPASLKAAAHRIIRKGMRGRHLYPGVFTLGTAVTVLESVCTGQVYLPVLVLLSRDALNSVWFLYLLLYNAAFIFPLLAVFAIACWGMKTNTLLTWSKRHMVYSKLLLGMFFLSLAGGAFFIH